MQMLSLDRVVCAVGLVTILLGGCGRSQTTRFYVITPAHRPGDVLSEQSLGKQLVLGIGPIGFPEYLDRPQIAGRANGNRLTLAEFDRWAEPLESGFSRVLAENLSALLSTDRTLLFPWKSTERIDYRIMVNVTRFDGIPGDEVSLIARWTLLDPDENELAAPKRTRIAVPTLQAGYEGVVSAMSEAVAKLSLDIVVAIRNHR